MGIYATGKVFGIRIVLYDPKDHSREIVYNKVYDVVIRDSDKSDAKMFYDNLKNIDNVEARIIVYAECCSTYGDDTFLSWIPTSYDFLSR